MINDIYVQMTEKIFMNGSELIPKLFSMIAEKGEAELLLAMPGTPAQLAERLGLERETVERMCAILYHKGLVFKSFKGDVVSYKMCRDLVQFHDATILWPEAPKAYHELWQRFMEEEWPSFAQLFAKLLPRPFTRIIPVETAVDAAKETILDIDSASAMVRNAAVVAVTKCTCRLIAGKCNHTLEACLQIDNAARYTIDRGSGREISKDEALALLKQCEQEGLVHVTINKAHAGHFICNCCACSARPAEPARTAAPSRPWWKKTTATRYSMSSVWAAGSATRPVRSRPSAWSRFVRRHLSPSNQRDEAPPRVAHSEAATPRLSDMADIWMLK